MAVSFASEPLLVKKDLVSWPPGDSFAILPARLDLRAGREECRNMLQAIDLVMHGTVYPLVQMTHAKCDDAAEKIKVLPPVRIPNVLVLRAFND